MPLPQGLALPNMQTTWASQLDPIIASPLTKGQLLPNVQLFTGTTVINHKLGRKLIGWFIVGIDGMAAIYDNQATNSFPALTLSLTSDADVTVSIWVF